MHVWNRLVPEKDVLSNCASPDLAGHGRTRTLALQKLHRICLAEVRTLKARYTLATVKLALSKYRERDPRRGPRSLGLAPKKNAFSRRMQPAPLNFKAGVGTCRPAIIRNQTASLQRILSWTLVIGPSGSARQSADRLPVPAVRR
jgi:hypothetical protein